MSFQIIRNDITNMQVDAIVNTANPRPIIGSGVDAAIHAKAGAQLLEERQKIGNIAPGSAVITQAYGLDTKYVIHTVGPIWRGGLFGEAAKLRHCYDSALQLALENGCSSIAFPLISTGNYGFPQDKALQIAIAAFSEFLPKHEMQIYLVVFKQDMVRLSEKLFSSVASYIDEHYVEEKEAEEYGESFDRMYQYLSRRRLDQDQLAEYRMREEAAPYEAAPKAASKKKSKLMPKAARSETNVAMAPVPMAQSLEDMLKNTDAGFSETLLKLIDQTGQKDSEIYKRANLTKQHFSKIRNNPDYKPTKATALALALALELDLEETKDLIGRAGYALTNSSKFDLIIQYYIEQKKYNVVEINMALYEFDQSLLGS